MNKLEDTLFIAVMLIVVLLGMYTMYQINTVDYLALTQQLVK